MLQALGFASLDELMDTRLAALAAMGEETMKKVFSLNHQYFKHMSSSVYPKYMNTEIPMKGHTLLASNVMTQTGVIKTILNKI